MHVEDVYQIDQKEEIKIVKIQKNGLEKTQSGAQEGLDGSDARNSLPTMEHVLKTLPWWLGIHLPSCLLALFLSIFSRYQYRDQVPHKSGSGMAGLFTRVRNQ